MSTADKLKHLLRLHNKRAVARAAGIEFGTLWNAMQGRRRPHLYTLRTIARVLEVDFGWLVDDAKGLPVVHATSQEPAFAA